ncbi:MAG: hypothetical protein WDA27_13695 [Actinomycetota bacterium]
MRIESKHPELTVADVRRALAGLPDAEGYEVIVKPLRYRTAPHLAAFTVFEDHSITLQVPEPFMPFGEVVHFGAKRVPGKGMKFVPLSEGLTFRSRSEVLRFLYCHEWYHWFLYEVLGKKSMAEIACDRFALRNFRRRHVTIDDARAALRRTARP